MAQFNEDGSIILSTQIDTDGIEQGLKQIKKIVENAGVDLGTKQTGISAITSGVSSAKKSIIQFGSEIDKRLGQAKERINQTTSAISILGKTIMSVFSIYKLTQFARTASSNAYELESQLVRLKSLYKDNTDLVADFIDKNSVALGLARTSAVELASTYGNIFNTYVSDSEASANLVIDYLNMTSVVASKTGRTIDDIQDRIVSGLLGNTKAIDDLGIYANESIIIMSNAFKELANGRSWAQLNENERKLIRTLAILEQSTKQYGNEVQKTSQFIKTSFQSAWEDFKSTWGQIINTVLTPLLEKLTIVLKIVTSVINKLMNKGDGLFDSVSDIESTTNNITDNVSDTNEELEETVALTERILAGFDDIQKLGDDSEDTTGGSANDSFEYLKKTEDIDTTAMDKAIDRAMEILNALIDYIPIAMVSLGVILMAFGQIGWGLGFIVGGAYMYSVTEKPDKETDVTTRIVDDLKSLWDNIETYLMALGLIMICFGQIGWGIAFVTVGAGIKGYKEYKDKIKNGMPKEQAISDLQEVATAIGAALAALGVILICLGQFGWGVGFVIAGVAGIAVGDTEITEQDVTELDAKALAEKAFKQVLSYLPTALEIIGLLVLCCGNLALGVGCLVASSWIKQYNKDNGISTGENSELTTKIKTFMENNKTALKKIASVMIVIGMIVMATGKIISGIGLILAGQALKGALEGETPKWLTSFAEGDDGWSSITTAFKSIADALTGLFNVLVVIGIILMSTGHVLKGMALIATAYAAKTVSSADGDEDFSTIVNDFFNEAAAGLITSSAISIGISLCVKGFWKIGVALIAAGGITAILNYFGLTSAVTQTVKSFVSGFTSTNIADMIQNAALTIGTMLVFTGHPAIGLALLAAAGAPALIEYFGLDGGSLENYDADTIPDTRQQVNSLAEQRAEVKAWLKDKYGDVIDSGTLNLIALLDNDSSSPQNEWIKNFNSILAKKGYSEYTYESLYNEMLANNSIMGPVISEVEQIELKIQKGIENDGLAYNEIVSKLVSGSNAITNTVSAAANSMSSTVKKVTPSTLTYSNKNFEISMAAKGAVIPPNQEFLAIYGDQRKGTNIETPLTTMIDAFNAALDKRGGSGDGGTVHVHVHLDGKEIYETVVKRNKENTRITGINEFAY